MQGTPVQEGDAVIIDARGLNCPLPVLRLRKGLRTVPAGAWVNLIATDRAALKDVPAVCAAQGMEVGEVREADGVLTFCIRNIGA